jgi:hypothetical protein
MMLAADQSASSTGAWCQVYYLVIALNRVRTELVMVGRYKCDSHIAM